METHRTIEIVKGQRAAAAEVVKLREQAYLAGKETINFLLEAQRDLAEALRLEHSAITNYNIALANFEALKGSILAHNNVKIMDGPLPDCVEAKASEHLRQRMGAIIVKESGSGPLFEKTGGISLSNIPSNVSVKEMNQSMKEMPPLPDKLEVSETTAPVLAPSSSGLLPPSAVPTGTATLEATTPVILPAGAVTPARNKPIVP